MVDRPIIYKPVDLMHIFSIPGGLPVKERSPQRQAYRLLEMERWRRVRNLPIVQLPKFYPADPSLAHRVFLAAIEELGHDNEAVHEFARRGLETRAIHEEGMAKKEAVSTEEAVSRHLFSAPIYTYGNEPFWGQDSLEMLDDVIKSGREPIVVPELERTMPRAARLEHIQEQDLRIHTHFYQIRP
ncbi:hypothetical protein EDB80DRAFT_752113 [Ilyonectria destructans]|nr:hypothetical protein EDB80DRAFT_752113 [Ilyonectria destructans]